MRPSEFWLRGRDLNLWVSDQMLTRFREAHGAESGRFPHVRSAMVRRPDTVANELFTTRPGTKTRRRKRAPTCLTRHRHDCHTRHGPPLIPGKIGGTRFLRSKEEELPFPAAGQDQSAAAGRRRRLSRVAADITLFAGRHRETSAEQWDTTDAAVPRQAPRQRHLHCARRAVQYG
jgi:hypothetical protein